jgi:hypothetical protein
MNRIIIALILTLSFFAAGNAQQAKPETKAPETQKTPEAKVETKQAEEAPIEGNVYREITVADFENIEFKDSDIVFQKSGEAEYKVAVRDETPAPVNSKKYIGVKIKATRDNPLQIKFPKDKIPAIDKYVKNISIWVYGKDYTGELSMFIMDSTGKVVKLSFGKLDFHGWRKLTKTIPNDISQIDKNLEKKSNIKVLSLLYVPGTWNRPGTNIVEATWQTFYFDDITANVREKYVDSQNDEW